MRKIITIGIVFIFLLQSFTMFATAYKVTVNGGENQDDVPQCIVIKVGVVHSAHLLGGMSVGKEAFEKELNYDWIVGDQKYSFELTEISSTLRPFYRSDLLKYDKLKEYDVIIVSGIQDELILAGAPVTRNSPAMKTLKKNLLRFVEEGGGYIGHCGGSTIPFKSAYGDQPRTWSEAILEGCSFIDSGIKVHSHTGMPILSEHGYFSRFLPLWKWSFPYTPRPEYIGYLGYLYYSGLNPSGAPVNLNVRDTDHPILRDYHDDTLLVRWGAGPSYTIPFDNPNIHNLLEYPWQEDPYLNESTRINYWSFNETRPLLKSGLATLFDFGLFPLIGKIFKSQSDKLNGSLYLTDWDYTDIPIKTEHANNTAVMAFNYPEGDESSGRMVISGCHPELGVWDRENNSVVPANDTDYNYAWEPLINWSHFNNSDSNPACWFVRRQAAWASGKVPDEHLPSVYGDSQVTDIKRILQESSDFIIDCNVGIEHGVVWNYTNLSLYYRHKVNDSDSNWTDWKCYDSTYESPWRFTFNTHNASGNGLYEFFSVLNTSNDTSFSIEIPPPAPDAECVVGGSIVAGFKHNPGTPRVNYTVYFNSESSTAQGTHITQHFWDFGDGEDIITGQDEKDITHKYTSKGTYTITHIVQNNLSQNDTIKKTITVLNDHPKADFEPSEGVVIRVGQTVDFLDKSIDPDGSIVNWSWDFGDRAKSYEQNPSHIYTKRGYYPVTLEVTDNNGMTNTKYKIDCVVATALPRTQRLTNPLYQRFIENNIDRFPRLKQRLDSRPYLRILLGV